MTIRALVVIAAAAAFLGFALTDRAGACSCAYADDAERYRDADAAVIGVAISDDGERGRIRVEHDFKVDLGAEVEVPTSGDGANCGLSFEPGQEVSLLLYRDGDGWSAGTCSTIDPDHLPGAKDRLPPAAGAGDAALLLYGSSSGGRVAALDADGRLLAYGAGRGEAFAVTPCPGNDRVVELAGDGRRSVIAVRRLRDLRVLRERPAPAGGVTLSCRDRAARRIVVGVQRGRRGSVLALEDGRRRTLRPERLIRDIDLAGDFAFIDVGRGGGVRALDLDSGAERRLPGLTAYTEDWAVSPDGTRAAAITEGSNREVNRRSGLAVVRLRGGRLRTVTRALPDLPWLDASVVWRGDDRLLLGGDSNRLRLYDARLRHLFTYASRPEPVKLFPAGDRLYGMSGDGVHVVEGPALRERLLAEEPARGLYNVLPLPAPVRIDTGG